MIRCRRPLKGRFALKPLTGRHSAVVVALGCGGHHALSTRKSAEDELKRGSISHTLEANCQVFTERLGVSEVSEELIMLHHVASP